MPPLNIPTLVPGDRVQADFLISDRVEKSTNNGDPYVVLTLSNPSGRIDTAPIWSNQREWALGAERGSIVQAIGQVSTFARNGSSKRQLSVTAPLRVLPSDQVDVSSFLPSIAGDCVRIWDWIDRTRADMQSATLRRVVDLFFADDGFRTRFQRTPGSVAGHHSKLGGLLLHTYEVTSIARTTARTSRANLDLVTAGALLHDIGKVEAYDVASAGFSYTPCGLLLGHVVLGCMMLERALAAAGARVCSDGQQMELQHIILSHHGSLEFGSPVQPMTLESEIVHWADEASAKSNDMSESLDDSDSFADGGDFSSRKPWRVGRKIWKRPHTWD